MSILSDRSNRPPASTVNPYPRNFSRPVLCRRVWRSLEPPRSFSGERGVRVPAGRRAENRAADSGRVAIHGVGSRERLFLDLEIGVDVLVIDQPSGTRRIYRVGSPSAVQTSPR